MVVVGGGVVVVGGGVVVVGGGVVVAGGGLVVVVLVGAVGVVVDPPEPGLQRMRLFLAVGRFDLLSFARAFVQEPLRTELTLALWAPAMPMPTEVRLIVAQAMRPIATCESRLSRLF